MRKNLLIAITNTMSMDGDTQSVDNTFPQNPSRFDQNISGLLEDDF